MLKKLVSVALTIYITVCWLSRCSCFAADHKLTKSQRKRLKKKKNKELKAQAKNGTFNDIVSLEDELNSHLLTLMIGTELVPSQSGERNPNV